MSWFYSTIHLPVSHHAQIGIIPDAFSLLFQVPPVYDVYRNTGTLTWELERQIQFHIAAIRFQLEQLYYGLAVALTLNRTIILPNVRHISLQGNFSITPHLGLCPRTSCPPIHIAFIIEWQQYCTHAYSSRTIHSTSCQTSCCGQDRVIELWAFLKRTLNGSIKVQYISPLPLFMCR